MIMRIYAHKHDVLVLKPGTVGVIEQYTFLFSRIFHLGRRMNVITFLMLANVCASYVIVSSVR